MKLPFKVYPSLLKTNKKITQTDLCTQISQNNILSPRNFWNSKSNEIGSASSQVGVEGADRNGEQKKRGGHRDKNSNQRQERTVRNIKEEMAKLTMSKEDRNTYNYFGVMSIFIILKIKNVKHINCTNVFKV